MSFKRTMGLDFFEFAIHVGVTIMLMIVIDSASHGPDNDGAIAGVVAVSLVVLAWRRQRALKQLGPEPGSADEGRMQELEQRVADLEMERSRVLELEERLDFTERMLTQQREREQLGRGN